MPSDGQCLRAFAQAVSPVCTPSPPSLLHKDTPFIAPTVPTCAASPRWAFVATSPHPQFLAALTRVRCAVNVCGMNEPVSPFESLCNLCPYPASSLDTPDPGTHRAPSTLAFHPLAAHLFASLSREHPLVPIPLDKCLFPHRTAPAHHQAPLLLAEHHSPFLSPQTSWSSAP